MAKRRDFDFELTAAGAAAMIATDKSLLMVALRTVGSIGKVQPPQEFRAAPWHLYAPGMGDDLVNFTLVPATAFMRVPDGTLRPDRNK